MASEEKCQAEVDGEGRLILSPDIALRHGIRPGVHVRIDEGTNHLKLRRPVGHLAKVYIEPTSLCNLACRTCIRNAWEEPLGRMSRETFDRVVEGIRALPTPPLVFFGGFGEPLFHPDILDMISRVKAFGATAELITNGTLLTRETSRRLIETGLDRLWVSLDGATPESYRDVRLGALLPEVLANLDGLHQARWELYSHTPRLGIEFVAMRRNIGDLPAVLRLGHHLGVSRVIVSNVLPYTEELWNEMLYPRAMAAMFHTPSPEALHVDLPKIDFDTRTREPLFRVFRGPWSLGFNGSSMGETSDLCPFVEAGATVVGWQGNVSPCLALLHDHTSFLHEKERRSRRYVVGRIEERGLVDLWTSPEYVDFRDRVQAFRFSYCTVCAGCELSVSNEEDCFGNTHPTCGGCLWAQGLIRCP